MLINQMMRQMNMDVVRNLDALFERLCNPQLAIEDDGHDDGDCDVADAQDWWYVLDDGYWADRAELLRNMF
jgi:hypothetical protein